METKLKVGDKVSLDIKRHSHKIIITGFIKEIKKSYGNDEVLLTNTSTSEFWTRSAKKHV